MSCVIMAGAAGAGEAGDDDLLWDKGVPWGAGEAGDIFPAFEVVTYVFRSMEIICWYQIGVYLFFFHKNAKGV